MHHCSICGKAQTAKSTHPKHPGSYRAAWQRKRRGKLYGECARRAETRRKAAARMRKRGMTQQAIADVLGVTRERARQLILEAS